jgi:hypothetical protein
MSTDQPTVTYRLLPDDPGYRVGDDGSVWSCLRKDGRTKQMVLGPVWCQLRHGTQPNGAHYVSIRRKSVLVHRLVLLVFVGPCPDGMECCHWDDDRSNNRLSNLRWDTRKANRSDGIRNGKQPRGVRHGMAKITEEIVRAIRSEYATGGVTQTALARKYGLGQMQVSRIIRGEQWDHIV